jgi:O-6-methylguanine DNA methyltransferase
MKYYYLYQTEIGPLWIGEENGCITFVVYRELCADYEKLETPLIKKTYIEIMEFLKGERTGFDVPLNPSGTEFQKKVWKALTTIPYGETCTYKQIAEAVDNPKGCRAVGLANNRNPIAIIVPCHRVIGSNGKLVGYAGGLEAKERLLAVERKK